MSIMPAKTKALSCVGKHVSIVRNTRTLEETDTVKTNIIRKQQIFSLLEEIHSLLLVIYLRENRLFIFLIIDLIQF